MFKEFIKYGKVLFYQGLNNSHSGNMSFRDGDSIYITRHGARLGDLSERDIVKVNLNDTRKDKKASVEVKVHRAVYLQNRGIRAIVHAHIPFGVVLSLKEKQIKPIDSEAGYYLSMIPVLACKKTICSDEVAKKLPQMLRNHKAVIVKGHGVFAEGKTIEEASMFASVAESACKIIYLSKLLK